MRERWSGTRDRQTQAPMEYLELPTMFSLRPE
jgi:hypothetical protein